MDIWIVWYQGPAMGVGWWPSGVLTEDMVEEERNKIRKRFKGKGGVETMVKRYVEAGLNDKPAQLDEASDTGKDGGR